MALDLGTAWIQVAPSFKGLRQSVEKEFSKVQMPEVSTKNVTGAFSQVARSGLAAVGAVGTAIGGLAAKGGFDRALSIEAAQAKLKGLGHDAGSIKGIMDSALASVKGTSYGLGDAATVAASLSAAGVEEGDHLTNVLKTVADTAQISGRSMSQVGTIFGSIAARGKLQGDDLLQLTSAGVPALQFLSEQLGVSSADVSEMVTKGQIDFDTFATAMQKGLGGAALAGGETFSGAMANVGAALSRLGEAGATPILNGMRVEFNALIPLIDATTNVLKPLAAALGDQIAKAAGRASELTKKLSDAISGIGRIDTSGLVGAFVGLLPVLGAAGGALGPLAANLPIVGGLFKGLTGPVGLAAGAMVAMVASSEPLRSALADLGGQVSGALPEALGALKTAFGGISDALGAVGTVLAPFISMLGDAAGAVLPVVAGAVVVLANALSGISGWVTEHQGAVVALMGTIATLWVGYKAANMVGGVVSMTGALKRLAPAAYEAGGVKGIGKLLSSLGKVNGSGGVAARALRAIVAPMGAVTAAQTALNIAMNLNPVGLIITAIFAVIAGLVLLYKHSETFRKIVGVAWNGIKNVVGIVVDWFQNVVGPVITAVWDTIKTGALWLWHNSIEPAWNGIKAIIGPVVDWIRDTVGPIVTTAWDTIKTGALLLWHNGIEPAWDGIKAAIGPVVDWIRDTAGPVITTAWDTIKTGALLLWHNGIEPAWDGIKGVIGPVVDWIRGTAGPAIMTVWNAIKKATLDLWHNAIKPAWDGIKAAMEPVFNWIKDTLWPTLKNIFGKVGKYLLLLGVIVMAAPFVLVIGAIILVVLALSGVLMGLAWVIKNIIIPVFNFLRTVVETVWNAIANAIRAVVNWFQFTVVPAFSAAANAIGVAFGWMRDRIGGAWNWIKNNIVAPIVNWFQFTVVPAFSAVANAIGGAFEWMRDRIGGAWNWIKDQIVAPIVNWFETSVVPRFILVKDAIVGAFDRLKEGIGSAWNAIKNAAKTPVEFIVNTVVGGLVNAYNAVATKFGADAADVPHVEFANGGFSREAQIGNKPIVWAEAGPEAYIPLDPAKRTRSLGIWAKTGQMLGALPMADGGIIGNIGEAVSGFFSNPLDYLWGKVKGLIGQVGSSPFAQMLARIPRTIAESIGNWVKEHLSSLFGGGGSGSEAFDGWWNAAVAINPAMAPYKQVAATVAQHESGFNPSVVNNWDSNAQAGTPSAGLMQFIQPTFSAYQWPGFGNWTGAVDQLLAWWNYVNARYGGPFNIPGIASLAGGGGYVGYAGGTLNAAAGTAWVGENGPELVDFKGGEAVYNRTQMDGLEDRVANHVLAGMNRMRVALIVDGHQMGQVIDGRISVAAGMAGGSRY